MVINILIYECRYVNLVQDFQRVDLLKLSHDEKLAFFLNLYNAMVIHAIIRVGCPDGAIDRRSFYSDFQYIVGGSSYSLTTIKNGILRNNRRPPYSLVKPFGSRDKRLEVKNFQRCFLKSSTSPTKSYDFIRWFCQFLALYTSFAPFLRQGHSISALFIISFSLINNVLVERKRKKN